MRQRLDGVAGVAISESEQTTEVIFEPGDHVFSADTFRLALRQADVDVVTMDVDACGFVEGQGDARRLRAGQTTFELRGADQAAEGSAVCVAGRLTEEAGQMRLVVNRLEPASDSLKGE